MSIEANNRAIGSRLNMKLTLLPIARLHVEQSMVVYEDFLKCSFTYATLLLNYAAAAATDLMSNDQ